jgi:hypothetical protein
MYGLSQQKTQSDHPGMETASGNPREITFYLTIRPSTFGRSDVVLRLYRRGRVASETVISTVRDDRARMMMLMSRMQLFRRGYDEHVLTLPHIDHFAIEATS